MSKSWIILVGLLITMNLLVVDVVAYKLWTRPTTEKITNNTVVKEIIYPTVIPTIIEKQIFQPVKSKQVTYMPIPGEGESDSNGWANVSGTDFYLDTADYPNLKEAYLAANLRLFNGNGTAFVRLFDVTAGIEVWGSEAKTSNQNFTGVTSGKLTLRPGNHMYRIQIKSLTADTAIYNSGRIKILSE